MENVKNKEINKKQGILDDINVNVHNFLVSKILKIIDYIIYITFAQGIKIYSMVYNVEGEVIGYVNSIDENFVEVFLLTIDRLFIYDEVYISQELLSIKFNDSILGTVIDPLGKFIFSFTAKNDYQNNRTREIFLPAASINERGELNKQFLTGFNFIDFNFPIGHGQRMLLIGDKYSYKTNIAVEIIKNIFNNRKLLKEENNTIFIYVSIGQRKSNISYVVNSLLSYGISNVLVIAAEGSSPLPMQVIAPFAAVSIAEHYARNKYNICVIIDDLTKHATAYKELNLIADKKTGRELYTSDIFYLHSSLLERSLQYGSGGSITCIPIMQTIDGDLSGYISTNAISITDGQLCCSNELLADGVLPPFSMQLSVSRTGSSVQMEVFKKIALKCKRALSLYDSIKNFYAMYRDECDESVKEKYKNGLFVIDLIYNINTKSLNILKQLICASFITHQYHYDKYTIKNFVDGDYLKFLSSTIESVYDKLILEEDISESMFTEDKINLAILDNIKN